MEPEENNKKTQESAENTSSISSDLIRGHINTIILRMLYDGDKYGYEIIDEIEEKSKGQYTLKQPTLYSALKRLESQDYVTSYWGGASNGGRRKYFQITEKGKAVVEQNRAEWEYSRTVIDSLISERDYDFSNPPPASSVDFQILKKSTSRVPVSYAEEEEDIELMDVSSDRRTPDKEDEAEDEETAATNSESLQETEQTASETQTQSAQTEQQTSVMRQSDESAAAKASDSSSVTQTASSEYIEESETREEQTKAPEPIPLTEAEKQRIHENYRALIGNEEDATSHYYAHVSKDRTEEPAPQQPYAGQYAQDEYAYREYEEQDNGYVPGPSATDMMYSSKSPAERNYKELLNKLYDTSNSRESYYEEMEMQAMQPQPEPEPPVMEEPEPAPQPVYEQPAPPPQEAPAQPVRPTGSTASNIEFYDVEEHAQRDGLRVTTTNGSKNRTMSRTVGNTFNKGKALFLTAVYVFIIMLAECIANHCLRDKLQTGIFYIVIPYVVTFLMLGVFLFLYLNGYGKNCRKSQSKTYISASFIIFVDIVLVIALVAYLVIFFGEATLPTWVQIVKYAVIPVIFT